MSVPIPRAVGMKLNNHTSRLLLLLLLLPLLLLLRIFLLLLLFLFLLLLPVSVLTLCSSWTREEFRRFNMFSLTLSWCSVKVDLDSETSGLNPSEPIPGTQGRAHTRYAGQSPYPVRRAEDAHARTHARTSQANANTNTQTLVHTPFVANR